MSSKISRILGVGLVVAVLASLFVAAAPASAATLAWSGESTLPTRPASDVFDIAAASNGTTIYAAGGGTNLLSTVLYPIGVGVGYPLAKSTNSGTSWAPTGLPTTGTGIPARTTGVVSVKAVAIAPDSADGSFLAVLVSDNSIAGAPAGGFDAVYASSDGGATWSGPGVPSGTPAVGNLNGIAISPAVNGVHSFAVAGTQGGAAKLWVLTPGGGLGIGGGTGWVDETGATANTTFMDTTQTTALAVSFSPGYATDRVIVLATANTGATTNVRLQLFNTVVSIWNSPVYTGWNTNNGVTVTTANATGADLALPSTYMANDLTTRTAYVGVFGASAATGGLFRVNDTATPAAPLVAAGIRSVALSTAGDNLVAGASGSNNVYRVPSPSTPTAAVATVNPYKMPGYAGNAFLGFAGDTMTVVAYAGSNVVAGNQGPESAFAVSTDGGKDFSDVSLVDSSATATDFTVAADGSKIYFVTYSATTGAASLWKKTTAYTRVFCQADTVNDYVVRIAPENSDAAYVAERGGQNVWYTNDGGATTWTLLQWTMAITDMDVESASTVWVANANGTLAKTGAGALFFNPVTTLAHGINMIDVIAANSMLVGHSDGYVSYTTDGATFTSLSTGGSGNVVATADKLSSGGNIYAATALNATTGAGGAIYRYTIGTSAAFTQIHSAVSGATGYGIALGGTTLYATFDNTTVGNTSNVTTILRSLAPSGASYTAGATNPDSGWNIPVANITMNPQDSITLAFQHFMNSPRDLMATVGSDKNPKIWALGSSSLESLVDTLTAAGPTLSGPANASTIPINAQTGQAMDVAYQWGAVTGATKYTFQVALDSGFTQLLATQSPTSNLMLFGPNVAGADGTTKIAYQPDTTYYWRVKVAADGPMDSPFSATGNFKIGTLTPLKIVSPTVGAQDVSISPDFSWTTVTGATNYEIFVSDDPTFAVITFSANSAQAVYASTESLAYSTTYYWRVRASAPAGAVTPFVYGIFTTQAKPTTPTPPITVTQPGPTTITVSVPPAVNVVPNYLLWIIIGIGAVLVIALIVLIVRTRRTS